MKKIFLAVVILLGTLPVIAQPIAVVDSSIAYTYTKTKYTLKALLPKAINFVTNKTTQAQLQAAYPKVKPVLYNQGVNYNYIINDATTKQLVYILCGNVKATLVSEIRVSASQIAYTQAFATLKSIPNSTSNYYLHTSDGYYINFVISTIMDNKMVSITIR